MLTLSLQQDLTTGSLLMCFKLPKKKIQQQKKEHVSKNAFLWLYIGAGWTAVSQGIFRFLTAIDKGSLDQIILCPQLQQFVL